RGRRLAEGDGRVALESGPRQRDRGAAGGGPRRRRERGDLDRAVRRRERVRQLRGVAEGVGRGRGEDVAGRDVGDEGRGEGAVAVRVRRDRRGPDEDLTASRLL